MNILSLFDGISCGQLALNRAGISYNNYYASEVDGFAIKVTQHNFPKTVQLGCILDIKGQDLPKIDLLLGGSPCQGFSFAGKQLNFEDPRSKLFFEYVRLLNECKPTHFLLENVVMKQEYQDIISDLLGVQPILINSALVSAQNRKRLYWTNIPLAGIPQNRHIKLSSIIGEHEGVWTFPRGFNKGGLSTKEKSNCVTKSSWQHNFFVVNNGLKRKFTLSEVEQLQTVPLGYLGNVPNVSLTQKYKALGNCWTVEVVTGLIVNVKSMENKNK